MTLILPIVTFAVIIGIQCLVHLLRRRRGASPGPSTVPDGARKWRLKHLPHVMGALLPGHDDVLPKVHGYALPDSLYYHQGHSWVWVQDAETVFVGLDDFARRIVGRIGSLKLPRTSQRCSQGELGWTLRHNGRKLDMLFPVDGEVVAVNTTALKNPELVSDDPYGRGWLAMVRTSNLKRDLRNLLSGSMAQKWMEESSDRLKMMFGGELGILYQDGGQPAEGVIDSVSAEEWTRIVEELFLVKP